MGGIVSVEVPADKIIKEGCSFITLHACYCRDLPGKLDALRAALRELQAEINDVQRRVDLEEHRGNAKRLDQVQAWFSLADSSIADANALIEATDSQLQAGNNNDGCFGGPGNCAARYKLGKKIAGKMDELKETRSKGQNFKEVVVKLPAAPAIVRPSEPRLVGVESMFDEACKWLQEKHVGIIALYGMGGVGKTTLLTEIHNQIISCRRSSSSSAHNFDYVIWVDVRRNQTLEELQNSICKRIGLEQQASRSQEDKYEDISRKLSGKKFILFLDNLWERLDLLKAGVPTPSEENGCKIVFTTRSEIVCGYMDAQKKIKLDCLDPEKALELFCSKVGVGVGVDDSNSIINHPEITELAKSVVKECGGLPLALITAGRAMASKKTPEEWSHAVETLQHRSSTFSGMDKEVLPVLKFSYDSLPNDAIKACLLRIALHPESAEITKRRLTGEWYAEGILGREHDRIQNLDNLGFDIIGTLVSMCLLEVAAEDERYVRLHNVIRDMLLWVASECGEEKGGGNYYLVEAGFRLRKVPRVGKWSKARVVSLMNNQIEEITEEPVCPHLEALYLGHNSLRKIAPDFFHSMTSTLRVLDLSHNETLTELPPQIWHLVNLESLNLRFTGIRRLPFELRNLGKLRVLDITGTSQLTMIPQHVLSSLSALQSLRMAWCGNSTDEAVEENNVLSGGNELLIEEVRLLMNLTTIDLSLRSDLALTKFLSYEDLMIHTKILSIELLKESTSLNISFLGVARQVGVLHICDCENLISLGTHDHPVVEADQNSNASASIVPCSSTIRQVPCFHRLIVLEVRRCQNLKDLTAIFTFAPNLEFVDILSCHGLETLITMDDHKTNGGAINKATQAPLSKLRMLGLADLPQLQIICEEALPFPCLNKVLILYCPQLKRLPVDSKRAEGPKIKIWNEETWWNELQWENEATANAFDPEFNTATFFKD
ncbi:hypothetical protein Dimus_024165 [Dionaea muscipula]